MNAITRLLAQFGLGADRAANLARLARFTPDDLTEFERVAVEVSEDIDDPVALSELAECVAVVRDVRADIDTADTADVGVDDDQGDDDVEEPEAVAADARRRARRMIHARPRDARPRATDGSRGGGGPALVASTSGQPLDGPTEAASEFLAGLTRLGGQDWSGRHALVAGSWASAYPEDRRLGKDPDLNMRRIDAVTQYEVVEGRLEALGNGEGRMETLARLNREGGSGLIAAGGLCAPVNVRQTVFGVGSTVRPLRDGLPGFDASRGGVRFLEPPQLDELDGAITIHTEAEDVAGSTKNVQTIDCGSEIEVVVSAIVARTQFGNFQDRFSPEHTARVLSLVEANHARQAEDRLWDQMCAAVGVLSKDVGDRELGAARDVIVDVARAANQLRARHRVPQNAVVEFRYPSWMWDNMRADLVRQLPGDMSLGRADEMLAGAFAEFNIATIGVLDAGANNQDWQDPIGAGGDLIGWPLTAETIVSFPGSFVFLDGGELNLGTVRDSTLNNTNDFQTFFETFEEVAHVAPESICLTVNTCPTGKTSAAEDIEPCGASDAS